MLLGPDAVLTCAHVVPVDGPVLVDLVGMPGAAPVPARADPRAWIPESGGRADPSGDVALLRLERPHQADSAVLHRLPPTWNREVRMYGFPEGLEHGVWFRARLAGLCGRDGRVQMYPGGPGEVARPGFSGAAVTDEETRHVIGIVVSRYTDRDGLRLSFMIPTETVMRHLPQVREWVLGASAVDGTFVSQAVDRIGDVPFAERLARWLEGGETEPVEACRVAPEDSARTAALRRAVTLADRELSPGEGDSLTSSAPPGTVPAVGSLDLAVDVTRRTTAEVAQRVCERMGLRTRPGRPFMEPIRESTLPLTIVVDGVDRAPDPSGLLELLALLAERGSRLLLVFHTAGEERLRRVAAELTFRYRLGLLTRQLAEAADRGRQLADRLPRVVAEEEQAERAVAWVLTLQEHLSARQPSGAPTGLTRLERDLGRYLKDVAKARSRIDRAITRLDTALARRDVLRGRLEASRTALRDSGAAEDIELAGHYRRAHDLLWRAPCDLPAAEQALERYLADLRLRPAPPETREVTR